MEHREVALTQGRVALVDAEDYERISKHKWQAAKASHSKNWYARRSVGSKPNQKNISMHRQVLNVELNDGIYVDHINGNSLDNRKSNIRLVTHSQNHMNERRRSDNVSGYKGVSKVSGCERWQANITVNRKQHYLGSFATPELAFKARCEAAERLHGEYARSA